MKNDLRALSSGGTGFRIVEAVVGLVAFLGIGGLITRGSIQRIALRVMARP
jgi:hypothetical protein